MAPLLRPSECSVLIVDALNSQASENTIIVNRDRLLEAASMCGIPSFVALYLHDPAGGKPGALSQNARYYSLPPTGVLWDDSAFGRALAQTRRPSVLLCGHWLEEYITFAAIKALSEGYDAYIVSANCCETIAHDHFIRCKPNNGDAWSKFYVGFSVDPSLLIMITFPTPQIQTSLEICGAESSQHDANATGAENGCLTHRRYDPAGARGLTPHRSPAAPATPWGRHAPGRGLAGLFRF